MQSCCHAVILLYIGLIVDGRQTESGSNLDSDVPGLEVKDSGSRYQLPCTRYQVPGTWYLRPDSYYEARVKI